MQRLAQLTVAASGYKTRTETFDGREHLVVPVVALVEGVVHAMNAKNAEFVAASEFSRAPGGWNGRPLFFGHPLNAKGSPVSGNSPSVLEAKSIGRIFNAKIASKKLAMEAWIDIEKAKEIAPEVLERVLAGETIEISVGVFVDTDDVEGEYEGRKYLGEWHDIVPDHLALLPKTDEGACSVEMGCGVRAAQKPEAVVADEKKTKAPSILGRFLQMFRAAQPANEMSNNDLMRKLYEALREHGISNLNYVEGYLPVTDPNRVIYSVYEPAVESGMGYPYTTYCLHERSFTLDANGIVTLGDAAIEVEPVLSYEPVLMSETPEGEPTAAKGARNSKADQAKIQAMHDHAIALGAYCDPKMASAPKTASGATSCSCGGHETAPITLSQGDRAMKTKDEMKAFVDGATEDQLKALAAVAEAKPVETPAVAAAQPAAAVVAAPAAAEVKEPTLADLMAKASPDIQAAFKANETAASAKKVATIKALKDTGRCTIADEALNGKSQVELDQLLALTGAKTVSEPVDFGGQGGPKVAQAEDKNTVPAPVDMNARILANRKK